MWKDFAEVEKQGLLVAKTMNLDTFKNKEEMDKVVK